MADAFEEPPPFETSSHSFADHAGASAVAVYRGQRPTPQLPVLAPRWSFQVYVTIDLPQSSSLQDIATQLLDALWMDMLELYPLRLDVYHLPGANHEACMSHYRREKQSRQADDSAEPSIVPAYTPSMPNFLIVLEEPRWQDVGSGATTVQFDPPPELRQDPESESYVWEDVYTQTRVPVGHGAHEFTPTSGRLSKNEESGEWEGNLFQVLDSLKLNDYFAEWQDEYDETIENNQDTG